MSQDNIDDKLGADKFYTDERVAHIIVDEQFSDSAEIERLVLACPAELYSYENGVLTFSYEGCLECGTCRIVSGGRAIACWDHPADGFGIDYRQG